MQFFVDFRVPLGVNFGDQGQHKKLNKGGFFVTFLGWGPGGFWSAFGVRV